MFINSRYPHNPQSFFSGFFSGRLSNRRRSSVACNPENVDCLLENVSFFALSGKKYKFITPYFLGIGLSKLFILWVSLYTFLYTARKGHPNFDNPLAAVDDKIREAYDSVPKEKRMASTHGRCAEISALQRAIEAGADLDGAMSISVDVKTGTIKNACKSCTPALKYLGISDGACKL